jgi:lytic starch monooxygenase
LRQTHKGGNCTITFCEDGKNCAGSCPISAHSGKKGALNATNGQSCYWFSNGCTVGCDKCDGTHNQPGHGTQKFLYKGMDAKTLIAKNLTVDIWNPKPGDLVLNQSTVRGLHIKPLCDAPTTKPTICDPKLRTVNTQAECGAPEDIYYYSPWRAPGAAPVIDACGSAGGRFAGQGTGGAGAQFENTTLAKRGDLGSRLPPMPSQVTWVAGTANEVGWTIMAHHGGGCAQQPPIPPSLPAPDLCLASG